MKETSRKKMILIQVQLKFVATIVSENEIPKRKKKKKHTHLMTNVINLNGLTF